MNASASTLAEIHLGACCDPSFSIHPWGVQSAMCWKLLAASFAEESCVWQWIPSLSCVGAAGFKFSVFHGQVLDNAEPFKSSWSFCWKSIEERAFVFSYHANNGSVCPHGSEKTKKEKTSEDATGSDLWRRDNLTEICILVALAYNRALKADPYRHLTLFCYF